VQQVYEPDLQVFAKLFEECLERCREAQASFGRKTGGGSLFFILVIATLTMVTPQLGDRQSKQDSDRL
jgi:hypothetical protein